MQKTRLYHLFRRLSLTLALAWLLAFSAGDALAGRRAAAPAGESGWLLLPELIPSAQLQDFEGFVPTFAFVYSVEGESIPPPGDTPGWPAGELIPVSVGRYFVEVGHTPHPLNRWRYEVRPGLVTVIRSGLVAVATTPDAQSEESDICRQWNAQMWAHVVDGEGNRHQIAAAAGPKIERSSILQLHEGTYVFLFNGLAGSTAVRADTSVYLPTAQVAPVERRDFRLSMEQNDAVDNLSIMLCANRPTQVLAGTYWGSYSVELRQYPYRERVWQRMDLDPVEKPKYARVRSPRIAKKVFTGPGSRPVRPTE